jgi:hypothetical protein
VIGQTLYGRAGSTQCVHHRQAIEGLVYK